MKTAGDSFFALGQSATSSLPAAGRLGDNGMQYHAETAGRHRIDGQLGKRFQ